MAEADLFDVIANPEILTEEEKAAFDYLTRSKEFGKRAMDWYYQTIDMYRAFH